MRGREAGRAGFHRFGDDDGHLVDLVVRRFALLARVTHHVAAHRAVTDVERGVDADVTFERAQVLGEGLEAVERDAAERRCIHAFDPCEELDEPVGVTGP